MVGRPIAPFPRHRYPSQTGFGFLKSGEQSRSGARSQDQTAELGCYGLAFGGAVTVERGIGCMHGYLHGLGLRILRPNQQGRASGGFWSWLKRCQGRSHRFTHFLGLPRANPGQHHPRRLHAGDGIGLEQLPGRAIKVSRELGAAEQGRNSVRVGG